MVRNYIKLSTLFYLLMMVLLFFLYGAAFVDLDKKLKLCLISFSIFSIIHFSLTCFLATILSLTNGSIRKYLSFLSVCFLFAISLLIYGIISGYYIGITNWGQAVDYKLFVDVLLRPFSFVDLILLDENAPILITGSIIITALSFMYYYIKRNEFDALANHLSKRKYMGFGSLLIPILLFYTISLIDKQYLSKSFFQNEIFISFVNPLDPIDFMEVRDELKDYSVKKIENFNKKNVILISVECLRADHLSFNGYDRATTPYLDEKYNEGKLLDMKYSTSTCANTFCGILSTLNSSSYQNFGNFKLGIHDYLRKQGYHINFLLSGLHDSFANLKEHYGENIDTYLESKAYPKFNVNDDEFLFDALGDVQNYNGKPNFFFVHLMSTHIGGYKQKRFNVFQPTFDYASLVKRQKRTIDIDEDAVTLFTNYYDNSIVQADDVIKRFLETLKVKGFMDNVIVAIMGDHGESLGEHTGKFGHKNGLWQEYIGIPIMFLDDDISFYKERTYASQIDIAPTIVDRLGLPIPDHWEGISLKNKTKNRITFHETTNAKRHTVLSCIEKRGEEIQKFIYIPKTDERLLYNLVSDPEEQNNLIESCENPEEFTKKLLNYSRISPTKLTQFKSEWKKNNVAKDKLAKVALKENSKIDKFLSKEFIKESLNIKGDIYKSQENNTKNGSSTFFFTWYENSHSNTLIIETNTIKKASSHIHTLLTGGIKTTHDKIKPLKRFEINNKTYLFSYDFQDIVHVHKDKSIRISSIQASERINKDVLLKLSLAIQRNL